MTDRKDSDVDHRGQVSRKAEQGLQPQLLDCPLAYCQAQVTQHVTITYACQSVSCAPKANSHLW